VVAEAEDGHAQVGEDAGLGEEGEGAQELVEGGARH